MVIAITNSAISIALTSTEAHNVNGTQNMLALFSLTLIGGSVRNFTGVETVQAEHPNITLKLRFCNQGKELLFN